ncbi:MAG: hypothetical protein Q8O52_03555 [Sulfuritalea sp.]|nr:hypothetical protein [Sulfuritalea sp.]
MSRILHLLLFGLVGSGTVLAQMSDPTRPADASTASELPGGTAAAVESGVQTVILRPGGKSAAVIDGRYVSVGDKLGDKRVLKISESEVVLKGEGGREVIKATPAIEKIPARKPAGAKPRTKRNTEGSTEK